MRSTPFFLQYHGSFFFHCTTGRQELIQKWNGALAESWDRDITRAYTEVDTSYQCAGFVGSRVRGLKPPFMFRHNFGLEGTQSLAISTRDFWTCFA